MKSEPPLIEPVPIDDDLCTGLAMIEDLGFGARVVLYTEQTCYESGMTVRVVKRKIVLPINAIAPGIGLAYGFLLQHVGAEAKEYLLRLML